MLRLRPYKHCDAKWIVRWMHDEVAFRQWSADRYNSYPITFEDIVGYYQAEDMIDTIWGMTAFDETGVRGHFIMRFPKQNQDEI